MHAARMLSAVVVVAALGGCVEVTAGADAGGATGSSSGSVTPIAALASGDASSGAIGCGQDPSGSVVLCEQIGACPGVDVDPSVFQGCGFRLGAESPLDLECVCGAGASLCPIGVPATCAQAQALLDGQTALAVCQQQDEGRCVSLMPPASATGSTCDKSCEADCAGAPDCIQLCGC